MVTVRRQAWSDNLYVSLQPSQLQAYALHMRCDCDCDPCDNRK